MKRVVVTGRGVVTPLGNDVETFCDGLLDGRSGIAPITIFDPTTLPTRIAGQAAVPSHHACPLPDRKIAFALEAARQAHDEAWGPNMIASPPPGGGISLGVGLELLSMDDLARWFEPDCVLPEPLVERLSFLQTPSDLCAHLIAERYKLTTPPLLHVSACAAGTDAIGAAYRLVASGRRSWMLAGGADSMINPLGVAGFCTLSATSRRNEEPERASRPFDRTRDGFVMGEGAGMMVLEALDAAEARGAFIFGEIVGYGNSLDAHKISDPHPEGRGAALALSRAIVDAGIEPEQIDAINAHGTGTPKNDPVETLAIKRILATHAAKVPISATKSMIGHLISAAGAVEAIAALECMMRGFAHPTINLNEPDPACDLDYVPHQARRHEQRHVLTCSFGFGGHNAALILKSPQP